MDRRACFDFDAQFTNGGGLQGQGFRLDIEGEDISDEDLYGKLDILCKAINATYEPKETRILLKGPGCEQ